MPQSNITSLLTTITKLSESSDCHSIRYNKTLFASRKDDTIFTPASANYVLSSIKPYLTDDEQDTINSIIQQSTARYPLYKNQNGRQSYNFWRTKEANSHFPFGTILNRFEFFRLPDDVDTTAMVMLTLGYSNEEALSLKNSLPCYANRFKLTAKTTLPQFKTLQCYSTWFGINMPIELDCCVLSNLMLWIFNSKLPLNQNDTDVIQFLSEIILNDYYTSHTFQIAPEYPRKAIILYHLARLISEHQMHFKSIVIEQLKHDLQIYFHQTRLPFAKMLLQTSLLRFNIYNNLKTIEITTKEIENYWWFTAGFLSGYSNPLLKKLAPFSFFHLRFSSQLLNVALILENRVLLAQHQKEKM